MRCEKCNSIIDESKKYCPKCGATANHDSERQERERILAERATLGRFPLAWIETKYVLFYYMQGRILQFIETFLGVAALILPLFFCIDFGAGQIENYLYTVAIFGVAVLAVYFSVWLPMCACARKGNEQGVPVLGGLAKRICNKKGNRILQKAARKQRTVEPPSIKDVSLKRAILDGSWLDVIILWWDSILGAIITVICFIIAYFNGYLG